MNAELKKVITAHYGENSSITALDLGNCYQLTDGQNNLLGYVMKEGWYLKEENHKK